MDWLAYPLADGIVWTFDNVLVPLGDSGRFGLPNTMITLLGFGGICFWLYRQNKYNKAAAADPDQLK